MTQWIFRGEETQWLSRSIQSDALDGDLMFVLIDISAGRFESILTVELEDRSEDRGKVSVGVNTLPKSISAQNPSSMTA